MDLTVGSCGILEEIRSLGQKIQERVVDVREEVGDTLEVLDDDSAEAEAAVEADDRLAEIHERIDEVIALSRKVEEY